MEKINLKDFHKIIRDFLVRKNIALSENDSLSCEFASLDKNGALNIDMCVTVIGNGWVLYAREKNLERLLAALNLEIIGTKSKDQRAENLTTDCEI